MSIFLIVVFCALLASVSSFVLPSRGFKVTSAGKVGALFGRNEEKPDGESDEDARERMRRKIRKGMYNDQGVAFAPWISNQIDEEAIIDDMVKREKMGGKSKKTSTLDRGEIETSEGMRWRMLGNQVDLAWITATEVENQGYVIEKRPSYGGDFQEVASFREVTQLQSKGVNGGKYRYTDPSTSGGSWVYRVMDCDKKGMQNVLCQCFVEVQTESESKSQGVVAIGFAAIFIALLAAGYSLDPPI